MGDEVATAAAQTADSGDTSTVSTETVLTGDAGTEGTEQNLDAGAEGNTDASADDTAASTDGDDTTGEGNSNAEEEGSHTPPDTYADFTMPEGMELDATALEGAAPLFKELGLTQEQSQKVIDLYAQQVQAGSQKQVDDFNQLMNDWQDKTKNDSEYGGDKFDENIKVAQSAITKFGTPELKQLLEDHGVGNHPEVVRFMVRVGHTLKEDVPGSTGSTSPEKKDRVETLYPTKK